MAADAQQARRVFVSYVTEDSDKVDSLCSALEAAGIPYWRDRNALGPGDAWKDKIRDAIRDGSLVFLGCFSEQSRTKHRSYMNEELTLAVEEFRLRPPGQTWMIPVRFDDGDVPSLSLGAGRDLRDLNYVDLFGDRYAQQLVTLVTTIHRLIDEAAPSPATTAASLASLGEKERAAEIRRQTKEKVLEPTQRIVLDDLIGQEVGRVVTALADGERVPLQPTVAGGTDGVRQVVETMETLWELAVPFCASMHVAARWAEPSALGPWVSGLRRLIGGGEREAAGSSVLLAARRIPALAALLTGAMTSVAHGRWDNLRALIWDPTTPARRRLGQSRLVDVIDLYAPFDGTSDLVTNVLARAAIEGVSVEAAMEAVERNKYRTPVAEWVRWRTMPFFADDLPGERAFDEALDRTEVLLSVLSRDSVMNQPGSDSAWWARSNWYGRSTWRAKRSQVNPVEQMAAELADQQHSWGPVAAGMFGGDPARAAKAIADYDEEFRQVMRQMPW